MQIIFKYKWLRGYGRLYDYALKYSHMITPEAQERLKILQFWRKYGLKATTDAYGAKRSTLYLWQKTLRESEGDVNSLAPKSTAPKRTRTRKVDDQIVQEIKRLRLEVCPNLGKDKIKLFLDQFCLEHHLKVISTSTIGRIIKDKKIYHHRQKVSHYGKIKTVKRTPKLRKPEDFKTKIPGDLVELDTIVKFLFGLKRYVITAVDTQTRYAFAWSYTHPNSQNAQDFFKKLEKVFPYQIKCVQTDNGSEFHQHFAQYLEQRKTIHFWNYKRQPYRNGHVEKYNRTIQDEFIDWNEILLEEPKQFNHKLMDYLIWYNTQRPHWSLNLKSPVDYLIENNYLSKMCWTDTRNCFFRLKLL